jgi:hypothetical protein|tara:strand:+ start:604 stop:942 length:339 start_codon:yes stop_codon:yes gene_type:complete
MSKIWLEELPEWIDPEVWEQYQLHRKTIKKPMSNYAEYLCIKQLDRARKDNHDPNELINTTIMKGWQGIVIPDKPAGQSNISPTRGGWGLNPDHQMQIALEEFKKGKDVKLN